MKGIQQHDLNRIHPYVVFIGRLHSDNCPPAGTAFPQRMTKWHELELIVGGQGRICVSGTVEEALPGKLFYRKPGSVVQGFAPYHSYFILFDMIADPDKAALYAHKNMDQLYGQTAANAVGDLDDAFPGLAEIGERRTWEQLCDSMHREFVDSGGNNQLFLKTGVLRLLLLLQQADAAADMQPSSPHREAVLAVKAWIDSDPSASYTLSLLARRAGMSRSLFGSQFTAATGLSPIAYVNQARIRAAKQLLVRTSLSVEEIACQCGFDNISYFFRVFKRMAGATPADYRKRFRFTMEEL